MMQHKRPRAAPDARPERRTRRAAPHDPLRALALSQKALQDRHTPPRQVSVAHSRNPLRPSQSDRTFWALDGSGDPTWCQRE